MTTVPVSRVWADLAVASSWTSLPATTRIVARRVLVETVGSALAGARSDAVERVVAALSDLGLAGHVPVPGRPETWAPAVAAMITGTAVEEAGPRVGCAGDPVTHFRPAGSVGAAALAAGSASGVALGTVLTAVATGIEVGCRLADALEPAHSVRGWDLDATVGHVAAVVAAGRLFDLEPAQLAHAVSVAATESAGHRGQGTSRAMSFQVGKAAGDAVEAALLADRGLMGPPLSIEGRRGMLALMGERAVPDGLTSGLGDRWVSDRLALGREGKVADGRDLRERFLHLTEPLVGAASVALLERLLEGDPESPMHTVLDAQVG